MAGQRDKQLSKKRRPASPPKPRSPLLTTEDYWAVWLGLGVIALAMGVFWAGSTIKPFAVTPGSWSKISAIGQDLVQHLGAYAVICLGFGIVFSISMWAMGRSVREFVPGYFIVFLVLSPSSILPHGKSCRPGIWERHSLPSSSA